MSDKNQQRPGQNGGRGPQGGGRGKDQGREQGRRPEVRTKSRNAFEQMREHHPKDQVFTLYWNFVDLQKVGKQLIRLNKLILECDKRYSKDQVQPARRDQVASSPRALLQLVTQFVNNTENLL